MTIALVAPATPLRIGGGRLGLWRPLRTTAIATGSSGFAGPWPDSIPGLAGWWDCGLLAALVDTTGAPVGAWGTTVARAVDKSASGRDLLPFHGSAANVTLPTATPRLSGLLGGLGCAVGGGAVAPTLDADLGYCVASAPVGDPSQEWTCYLVWSRPNWRQGSASQTSAATILMLGDAPILAADGQGGARLILFPGSAQTTIKSDLARRHTHSIVLRNTPGSGLDVWLDDARVATGLSVPLPSRTSTRLLMLHDGTANGSAQCWMHEAAIWQRSITDTEITTLQACAARWYRGPRRGIQILVVGQSNAGYGFNDGAWDALAQGVAWHLGALAWKAAALWGSGSAYTCISGHGLYALDGSTAFGDFLHDPGDGSSPASWSLGADGAALRTWLGQQPAEDTADISLLLWPWNETDSLRSYASKASFKAAVTRFLALERAMLGKSAAAAPLLWWNAIPYGNADGIQMHREVVADLAADTTQNVVMALPMTADSNPRGASWDPATGIFSGGDPGHRDSADNMRFGRIAAVVAARAALAAGYADSVNAIPAGLPSLGGPRIVHAWRETNSSIVVTIAHDAGSDLKVPLQAANGAGFAVMDGGSVVSPGTVVTAVSCVRIDATHLRLSLSTALQNPSGQCALFYPYGASSIGRGNAVTDNFSDIQKPAGWDIGSDLGTAWDLDYPLAATSNPLILSDSP